MHLYRILSAAFDRSCCLPALIVTTSGSSSIMVSSRDSCFRLLRHTFKLLGALLWWWAGGMVCRLAGWCSACFVRHFVVASCYVVCRNLSKPWHSYITFSCFRFRSLNLTEHQQAKKPAKLRAKCGCQRCLRASRCLLSPSS